MCAHRTSCDSKKQLYYPSLLILPFPGFDNMHLEHSCPMMIKLHVNIDQISMQKEIYILHLNEVCNIFSVHTTNVVESEFLPTL